jgi:nitroimidazol reductase NimA-like FMN-containing flavoprotein (pyridoxamine 5'-phosphate oxidase superfamily)
MRRRDREITDREEMELILHAAPVCRLGMAHNGEPYVVPVCFGYKEGSIYIHSACEGEKITMVRGNPRVCVEVDLTAGPIKDESPCAWEMRYKSVICFGTAVIITSSDEKKKALDCILDHYGARPYPFAEQSIAKVCVIRIDVDRMTGKKCG